MATDSLDAIVELLSADSAAAIPGDKVRSWMETEDIELLGALYEMLTENRVSTRIQPPLTLHEHHQFIMRYYARCLRENPQGKWADSRYSAGADCASWFQMLWHDSYVPRALLSELRQWLAEIYIQGDETLKECIVTAILEHLFADHAIRKWFSTWKQDPQLREAWDEAVAYADERP